MTALTAEALKEESYYNFLVRSLHSQEIAVYPLAGDASARRYYRVVVNEQSWVLMLWEPFQDDEHYPFLSVLNHFHKNGVHVPQVHSKSPQEGLVLLEDLGDLTLERKFWENQSQEAAIPFYEQAIDEIIKIHYAATADKSPCIAFQVQFDTDKLLWELNYARTHLLEGVCKIQLSDKVSTELQGCFTQIAEILHQEEKFIAHRDYHSRNLMIKHGKMRVIDFQDARMGPVQYDLVSLLRDSYVNMSTEMEFYLLDYYLECRRKYIKTPVSREHFDYIYDVQTIQRCFKACGSFASFFNTREDRRYLKYLPNTLARVSQTLEDFPQFKTLYNVLLDNGVVEKDYNKL